MKLRSPKLPPNLRFELISQEQFVAEAPFGRVGAANIDISNRDAKGMSFDESKLEKILLIESKLEKLSLMDVALKACDFSAARCSESSFIRTHIIGGRMIGIDLSRSTLKDVIFEDCKLDMANFRFTKLTRVQFINCMMNETDFQAAGLTDVEFQNSHLEKTEFGQSKLKNVDARSSQLINIKGWQSLKGLTVDSAQLVMIAPQLAVELGLVIKDS